MIDLPDELLRWVESLVAGRVVAAERHFAGASREAWRIDVAPEGAEQALFLLRDKGDGGGSARDASVLRALAATDVPVPRVLGQDSALGAILMTRLSGASDLPALASVEAREAISGDLMHVAAALHALDVDTLAIGHLERPRCAEDCARAPLEAVRGALEALGATADPFFGFAHRWLEANVPDRIERVSLVHSDLGPGNFLFEGERVTGLVDWEVAHFGDPMEDLAALAVRDMATPVGSLSRRLGEYEAASGHPVTLSRVHYYRALVLVRNALMIGLGLATPAEGFDVVEMTMYQTLLTRAAALVLCDNLGVSRPSAADAVSPADGSQVGAAIEPRDQARVVFLEALRRDLDREVRPAVGAGTPAARVVRAHETALSALAHEARVGPGLDAREMQEMRSLLGDSASSESASPESASSESASSESASPDSTSRVELEARLRDHAHADSLDPASQHVLAAYFARRFHRLAERRRPLMGALHERLPQPLEDA